MAAASPSPLASSVEKTNGAKLGRLLIDGGTTVLRKLFDHYHPPEHLATSLNRHYKTLNDLFGDGHLYGPQWYQLFPTDGSAPDSKNFDISLLFLLLTNICGLSPPRRGWHKEPQTKDHSREANLARIKFFRNKVYGHVTSTGIDTHTFNALWRQISGTLSGLGLDKAEIDKLKAEHCGEEDYIGVLCAWSVSEQDIKSQLEDIQTEIKQSVNELHRTILQDSQKKSEEIHQVQINTQQTVDEVRQSQTKTQQTVDEVLQSQTKTQQSVDEVRQSQTKTQQSVDEVRQSQTKTQRTVDEVRQSQTKTQQSVDEVCQSQIRTQQTVDEVRQSQTKTQQTVDEIRQSQTITQQTAGEVRQSQTKTQQTVDEIRQSQTKTQQTADEVRQCQTKTQQTVDEVRQNQLEDRRIIQDSNTKLQEVFQMDKKTHQVVANVHETQTDDSKVIQEIRLTQHEFHKTLQETKSRVEEIQQTHEKRFECLRQDLKQTAEDLEGQKENQRENEILKKLAKIDTLKNVRQHSDRYVEGTRLSIFAKVESWLNDRSSPNRVMVISGNAGMGKTVISAVMCQKMQEAARLAGSHFCQHDRARHRNPKVRLQSLASQLCDFRPDYKKAVVEKLSRNLGVEINNMEVKELFEVLFEEPLTSLNDPGLTYLMVIDGLDESEFQGRNELLDVIANYFQTLPLWIRFLVTTRPERNIAKTLKNLHPLQLDPNVEENVKDIHLCFEKQISHLLQSEHQKIVLQALVQKSEGVMLYAHYLADFIKREVPVLTPELLDSILPSGISSVYLSYFKRLETELCKELEVTEENFLNFLSALAAAREPLPLGFVPILLLPGKLTSVAQRKVKAAIACVSALLPIQEECIHFIHKSVKDWLIEKYNYEQHCFSVDEKEGHEVLSKLCIDELSRVKREAVDWVKFTDPTKYALQHGVQHMLQLEDARVCSLEEVVRKFVLDVELVYAKLCVNVTAASEDIVCVQKQVGLEELQRSLNTLLFLLRKHLRTLEKLPHNIFQTLLNEGGPELSSEALHLLETKYSEIAYMEYLLKEDLQGGVQVEFECSTPVTCFDVSPQLDYMVCECSDNTIQLWSLHTGKQLWKRDALVQRDYLFEYNHPCSLPSHLFFKRTKRRDDNYYWYNYLYPIDWSFPRIYCYGEPKSLCRSVAFHPSEDLVLPGILSHAYMFDGDLKPLFLSSKCRFSVCSISAEKAKMLTDCPDDAKSVFMWSLKDGSEINRFTWSDDIVSFAWSRNGRLLAISDVSGSLSLVDVIDGYRTLAQTPIRDVCGMIKFSPDCRCLYSLAVHDCRCYLFRLDVNMENDDDFSFDVTLMSGESYRPWEFESCSETGYLLGDPFCFPLTGDSILPWKREEKPSLAFVLNEKSVLTVVCGSSTIEMLPLDELTEDGAEHSSETIARKVVLSLDGDMLYVITRTDDSSATLMAWDITSGMFKPGKRVIEYTGGFDVYNLLAVREGVLLQTSPKALELWNVELSECIRSWTDLEDITEVIPISEERVVCEVKSASRAQSTCEVQSGCEGESKVIIVDTTREGNVSTIAFHGKFVGCNSKCYVISAAHGELQMKCGDKVLWKISQPFKYFGSSRCKTFSPTEQYYFFSDYFNFPYVLDVVSGKTLRTLQPRSHHRVVFENLDCKFFSDEECIICFSNYKGKFLQLFNVKSGDLLSEITTESLVHSLTACPRERLVAIAFKDSKVNFKVLRVKLPGEKHRRKSKRSGFINKKQSYNTMIQPSLLRNFNQSQ